MIIYRFTFFVIVQSQIPDLTKLFRKQGSRLRGTNRRELLSIRVLVVGLVKALVALVQAHVDLVLDLVDLFQAQLLLWFRLILLRQGFICVVRR